MHDHPIEVVGVSLDEDGLQLGALRATLAELRAVGKRPPLHTIPTFHNPVGVSFSAQRRQDLLAIAAEHGLVVVEDDIYRELVYEGHARPPSGLSAEKLPSSARARPPRRWLRDCGWDGSTRPAAFSNVWPRRACSRAEAASASSAAVSSPGCSPPAATTSMSRG